MQHLVCTTASMQPARTLHCCRSAVQGMRITLHHAMCTQLQVLAGWRRTLTASCTTSRSGVGAAASDSTGTPPPYTSTPVQRTDQVPVPLCQRPASHTEQLSSLLQWRQDVLQEIQGIRDSFATTDGGPTAAELQKEVTWVLDDAVAAWRELDKQQWLSCSWQQLQLEVGAAQRRQQQTQTWQVQLRVPIADLQQLWRLRLQERVPFQYLIHTAHWRDLVLSVGPGILVPRPETELMVDLAAAVLAANPNLAALPWADLGTGSGALAIGAARLLQQQRLAQKQLPPVGQHIIGRTPAHSCMQEIQAMPAQQVVSHQLPRVYAVDISPTATVYAAANATAHGVQDTVCVLQGSWCEPLQQQLHGQLGVVLSNPPYIPETQMRAGLQAEVGQHEPLPALAGGPGEGLDSLQVICQQAVAMLAPGGFLALETAGAEQAPLVAAKLGGLTAASGSAAFKDVQIHPDCFGVPRFVTALRL